ncbi:MAG TPA: sporulation protein [Phototrophicaceae bacterium]|jgi:hypothetical protein|nr:sporulation protein [Phototrophicaceae bacterium]
MFGKLKQFVGMVGIDVVLDIPDQLPLAATSLIGTIRITAKQDQHITTVKVGMKQVHQEGSGKESTNHEYNIGELVVTNQPFDIKNGETKEFPFTLNFTRRKTMDQQMSEKGGVLGVLGKVGKMMDNERDNFWVNAMADVKGAALDPNNVKAVRFV